MTWQIRTTKEVDVPYGHPQWGTCICGAQWPCLAAFSADDLAGHCDEEPS